MKLNKLTCHGRSPPELEILIVQLLVLLFLELIETIYKNNGLSQLFLSLGAFPEFFDI